MKSILFVTLFSCIALGIAIPLQEIGEPSEEGWFVPNENGSFYWVSKEEAEKLKESSISGRTKAIKMFLYTNENPLVGQQIDPSNPVSLKMSNFNASNPTRIIIHGWQNSYLDDVNTGLTKAYLQTGDYNVICVDWSANAKSVNYPAATYKVRGVGQQVAAFIDLANEHNGLSFETLEINGHSLGAHCAGHAGKNVKRGKIHVIRGMDTASPLFSYSNLAERLTNMDAVYVESIHTNGGKLGFLEPIGDAAFYPNGGKSQPGCGFDFSGACSHSRSHEYLGEAIVNNKFLSVECSNHKLAIKNKCGKSYSHYKLGDLTNHNQAVSGIFYTPVNKKRPYGTE